MNEILQVADKGMSSDPEQDGGRHGNEDDFEQDLKKPQPDGPVWRKRRRDGADGGDCRETYNDVGEQMWPDLHPDEFGRQNFSKRRLFWECGDIRDVVDNLRTRRDQWAD